MLGRGKMKIAVSRREPFSLRLGLPVTKETKDLAAGFLQLELKWFIIGD